jgi:hypothetical protein
MKRRDFLSGLAVTSATLAAGQTAAKSSAAATPQSTAGKAPAAGG